MVNPKKFKKKINLEEMRKIRAQIDDCLLKDQEIKDKTFKKNQAIEAAQRHAPGLTEHQLAEWIDKKLVHPIIESGMGRNTHQFKREQIAEIVLAHRLHTQYDIPYAEILGLLYEDERSKNETPRLPFRQFEDQLPTNQKDRAIKMLRSRILGIILTWFFGKNIPTNMLILVRKTTQDVPKLPKGNATFDPKEMSQLSAQDEIGLIRESDDIFGRVSPESEVLFSGIPYKHLKATPHQSWLRISIVLGEPAGEFILMFGFEKTANECPRVDLTAIKEKKLILGLLLAVVHSKGDVASAGESEKQDNSTMLRSLADVIPTLSKNWGYCAILAHKSNNHEQLEIIAASHSFPIDLQKNLPNIKVEYGKPLSGWSIEWDYAIKIQQIDPEESWPAFQGMEKARASFALPTHANDRRNGVLYVGTSKDRNFDELVFDDNDTRVLQILAEVIGELIERNLIRQSIEASALRIIKKPAYYKLPWENFKPDIIKALQMVKDQKVIEKDNLHFTVVKTFIDPETADKHPNLHSWFPSHVLDTSWEFINRNYDGQPSLYMRHDHQLEFVIFMPDVHVTDQYDREKRTELRKLLCSVDISSSQNDKSQVKAFLWTMPFRKENIKNRLFGPVSDEDIDQFATRIVKDSEELFLSLPHLERAHEYEWAGNHRGALEQFRRALSYSPDNTYLIRHIAKEYEMLQEYQNAIQFWRLLIEKEYGVYPLARCARACALAGQMPDSLKYYLEAWERSKKEGQNPTIEPNQSPHYPHSLDILISWADVLESSGEFQEAIDKYNKALAYAGDDCDPIWMSMAGAYARRYAQNNIQSDFNEAVNNTMQVLGKEPNNREAW